MRITCKIALLARIGYALLMLSLAPAVYSATITATNVSSAAVQAAINAAVDGDTVVVPAGNAIWSSQVTMGGRGITLMGAGLDKTVIVDAMTASGNACLLSDNSGSKPLRVTGFTFVDSGPGTVNGLVGIAGAQKFRVDHCRFTTLHAMGVKIWGDSWGVVDHCVFDENSGGGATGVSLQSDGTIWATTTATFGTLQAAFIEDCTFGFTGICNGAVDSYNGARWVFRHNSVTNTYIGSHGCDSGGYRSTFSVEAYENVFINAKTTINCYMQSRGGAGIYYNNTCFGNVNTMVLLQTYRFPNAGPGSSSCTVQLSGCQPWGECTGSNRYDGNILPSGYPALDQCGWTGPTTFLTDRSIQIASPVYSWSNRLASGTANFGLINTTESCVQSNRDFFDGIPLPGYRAAPYPHPLVQLNATNFAPVVIVRAMPDRVANAVPVSFSSLGTHDPEGVLLTYAWDFGDGVVSTEQNPTHAYSKTGSFKVRLDVSDGVNTTTTNLTVLSQ